MSARDKYFNMLRQKGELAKWLLDAGVVENIVDGETLEATLSTFTCDYELPTKTFMQLEHFECQLIDLLDMECEQ